jgi:signal transduction histidine kinase
VGREVATNSTNAEQVTRIAEEALANAVKHSHATQISMTLTGNGTTQRLTITDNGRGFDLGSAATDSTGLGLRTMQERADLLPNGRLFIEAIPNHGTTIQLQWEEKTA